MPSYKDFGLGDAMVSVLGLHRSLPRVFLNALARRYDEDFSIDVFAPSQLVRCANGEARAEQPRGFTIPEDVSEEVAETLQAFLDARAAPGHCVHLGNLEAPGEVKRHTDIRIDLRKIGTLKIRTDWHIKFTAKKREWKTLQCQPGQCVSERYIGRLEASISGKSTIEISINRRWRNTGMYDMSRLSGWKNIKTSGSPNKRPGWLNVEASGSATLPRLLEFDVTPERIEPISRGYGWSEGGLEPRLTAGGSLHGMIAPIRKDCHVKIETSMTGFVNPPVDGTARVRFRGVFSTPHGNTPVDYLMNLRINQGGVVSSTQDPTDLEIRIPDGCKSLISEKIRVQVDLRLSGGVRYQKTFRLSRHQMRCAGQAKLSSDLQDPGHIALAFEQLITWRCD